MNDKKQIEQTGQVDQIEQAETAENNIIKITGLHIRIVVYGLILLVCVFFLAYNPVFNKISLKRAESCFNAQNYVCAFKNYNKAFATGLNNEKYVEHYVDTLKKMKKNAIVQNELIKIMREYPNSNSVSEINNIFENLQKEIAEEYKENYIDFVAQGTNIVHWNNVAAKIKVYIDSSMQSQLPGFYYAEIKNALTDYTRALDNAVQFHYVENASDADIQVIFVEEISAGNCVGTSDCLKILGLTENEISGSVLQKSVVKLRVKDTDNTKFTANQIYNIAKHELGHALGVSGHSYFSEDVMYPVNNDASYSEEMNMLMIKRKPFSKRDLNTFKLLYRIIPDITNKRYNIKANVDMFFPIAVLGTKKQIGEKNLAESNNYIGTVATNFVSQMNLAEGFFANQEFDKAKDAFSEALSYAKTDDERFAVYNNLAVILYEEGDYVMALSYAETANSYSSVARADEIKAYCLIEMKKYAMAEKVLLDLIAKNPTNVTYSAALAGVYLKQFKFLKMNAEMKRIKKLSPDAFLDPAYQPYKLFANFV